ncbi:MAG: hypothetical protein JWR44_3347 [Hymenobacter sp.]|jgi:hypothetical protein|nr:hypothetical protein [Hymenobacter sp.]
MKTKEQSKKDKSHQKRTKHIRRTYGTGSYFEPLAGEQDQDYLPMAIPGPGALSLHDFGRPGW